MTRNEKVQKIEELRKGGMALEQACKKVGMSPSNYYKGRQELGLTQKRKPKPKASSAPETLTFQTTAQPGSFIVFGSPAELAEFARSYHA